MNSFYHIIANAFVVAVKNNFVWFALTFWIYLTTQSVVSTGLVGGIYMICSAASSFWLGSIVDNHKKKTAMLVSSIVTLICFSLGLLLFLSTPSEVFTSISSPILWVFTLLLLLGAIAGNIFGIAVPTLVTLLVDEKQRDKANGLVGTVMGISFIVPSIASGFVLAYGGMQTVLLVSIVLTLVSILYLVAIHVPENRIIHIEGDDHANGKIDVKGTIKAINSIPGLFALILFTTFNNFLGGAFMALMDAYGLSLVSVEVWGTLFGVLSFGFIFGGIFITKFGLGKEPLRTLFKANIAMWIASILFTIQPSIVLLSAGIIVWIMLVPFIEATEQTIIQKVVPPQRQGRVFGFAHSIEQAASPLTAFLIGPIAQYFFIPFMSEGGRGAELIGDWFGVGTGRGIALVFVFVGIVGLLITLIAMRSRQYKLLAKAYSK